MPRIHRLPPHEAHKIAAGEVVERPANVVKELIENALDAGATSISIYVEDGGKKLIRIIDDGSGMSVEDAHLCIEHHTTSKIRSVDDLKSIQTFGFRGEALSSICAVSQVVLVTKEQDATHGLRLEIEAGKIVNESQLASNKGTDIAIANIFYNVPARKKFLKKKDTELNHIIQLVHALSIDYHTIQFKLFSDDRQLINCPAANSIIDRIAQLFDPELSQQMLSFEQSQKNISLNGVISNHQQSRFDRNQIFIFVNNRWVKNYGLVRALIKGYMNVLPAGRFPIGCIKITIDPTVIDVNIHPRKEEVQFLNPRIVENLITETTKQQLQEHVSAQLKKAVTVTRSEPMRAPQNIPLPIFHNIEQNPATRSIAIEPALKQFNFDAPPFQQTPQLLMEHELVMENTVQEYTIIGQYHKTYIILEQADGLFLIDQHAAHERILYELFSQRFDEVATVQLLFPQFITLTQQDIALLIPHLYLLQQHGIMVEPFGQNQLLVQATPVHIKDHSVEDIIKQVIGWITEYQTLDKTVFFKTINEKIHAQMACKAAVKAGDILTIEKMQQLIRDLFATNNRFTCPHGRPTGWLLHLTEIEKKFKRDYKRSTLL